MDCTGRTQSKGCARCGPRARGGQPGGVNQAALGHKLCLLADLLSAASSAANALRSPCVARKAGKLYCVALYSKSLLPAWSQRGPRMFILDEGVRETLQRCLLSGVLVHETREAASRSWQTEFCEAKPH